MAALSGSSVHVWYTPEECAELLGGRKHGTAWRAACPVHGGDNHTSLRIGEGRDADGNPVTLLHCYAHNCTIEDLCAAMGIKVRNLFCVHPDYAKATRHAPRTHSPRIADLKKRRETLTSDEIAQVMLEYDLIYDQEFLAACAPARAKLWELATTRPQAREAFTSALREAHIPPARFWDKLEREMERI